MSAFSFDFSALNLLARDLGKIAADVQRNERAAVSLAGNAYKNDVQPLLQYKSGTLRRSVHVELTTDGIRQVALIGTNLIYAKQREYGGIIKAKNGPYLRFRTYDGKWVTTKQVYQPPHPAWRPAFDNNLPKYRDIMIAALAGTPYAGGSV
jgi:phage gpG-like protein